MSMITQTLTAGDTVHFPGSKNFILVDTVNAVTVTFFDVRNRPIEKFENVKAPFCVKFEDRFAGVSVYSASTQEINIVISKNDIDYGEIKGTIYSKLSVPDGIVIKGNITATSTISQLFTINEDRSQVIIQNLSDVYNAHIGDNTVTNTRGVTLFPQMTLILDVTCALYAICLAGETAELTVTELIH